MLCVLRMYNLWHNVNFGVKMFIDDLSDLKVKHTSAVYALLLAKLDKIIPLSSCEQRIKTSLTTEIRKLFLNHKVNLSLLNFHLQQASMDLKKDSKRSTPLTRLIKDVTGSIKDKSLERAIALKPDELELTDLDSPFARCLESHIAIELLKANDKALWQVVNKISLDIVEQINNFLSRYSSLEVNRRYESFLSLLGPKESDTSKHNIALAYSRFASKPTLKDVLNTLSSSKDFVRVMLIQFMYMREVYPVLELSDVPLKRISAETTGGDFSDFLAGGEFDDPRYFFTMYTAFCQLLYADRGRTRFNELSSTQMGIMLKTQDRSGLPTRDTTWYPDCLCNVPDLDSSYVQSLTLHDIPYVSGPSGMTSLLSGAMTFLGQLSLKEKTTYTLAIMTFIVSGGLHSIHEVLSVPAQRLGLLKGYQITGANMGNYADYFTELSSTVTSLPDSIDKSFETLNRWIDKNYAKQSEVTCYDDEAFKVKAKGEEASLVGIIKRFFI